MKTVATLPLLLAASRAARILQSNDDGWAEKNIRVFNDALVAADNDVVLSAPADNQSGTSSLDRPPESREEPYQFDSCPANSPAVGTDPNNPRLQYVNSFPVTSIKSGISDLAPRFFDGQAPELAVTGPNVGSNLDVTVQISGTLKLSSKASLPSPLADARRVQYLKKPTHKLYAQIYADLATNLTTHILESGTPYLPDGVWLNVNFPSVNDTECNDVSQFQFVLSRISVPVPLLSDYDVETCGDDRLPLERQVVDSGCFVSVSPGDADDKTTVEAERQAIVQEKLSGLLTCLS
ncbi:hypothetical protein LTR70_009595 [Exophiala xenobiotica]|uniref:Survival protein SurE-like phosphatase/nucleotidase domain-containing protein n=1 Tax=Lithohypha guttulata TaxID=1690604 RepID=A0ABR0JWK2_9EURO|nr:hypothetical protein LTR24_009577 [Lithohypha guttulata]KAK5310284.1 hypothetical protein LTR70_009595 [Exophiala xenobiotica]